MNEKYSDRLHSLTTIGDAVIPVKLAFPRSGFTEARHIQSLPETSARHSGSVEQQKWAVKLADSGLFL